MNEVLVTRSRGECIESFHRGAACIVNEIGHVVWSTGDLNQLCFTRSALKLFQSIPLVESGAADTLALTEEEIAITCGSHNAEEGHVEVVKSILNKCSLNEGGLNCGPQMPTDRKTRKTMQRSGEAPQHIHNNCSGKHAGFLALCRHFNWSTDTYLSESHPAQLMIKEACAKMFEVNPDDFVVGEDGCSAPNYAANLYHLASAYKNLVCHNHSPERNRACQRIVEACIEHPFMIAGTDRYCTDIIRASEGRVIGKTGADGVFCMAFPELKLGCAIKIDDGKMGPQYVVAQTIIEALAIPLSEPLGHYGKHDLKNWNRHTIGVEAASEQLVASLGQFTAY